MNKPAKDLLVGKWLSLAEENYKVAKTIINEEFAPYHTVCFMCQSAVEKYLKAFLLNNGWPLKKTHDLSLLLNECISFNKHFVVLFDQCELLNEYSITGRYPEELTIENITKTDAQDALHAVGVIFTQFSAFGSFDKI